MAEITFKGQKAHTLGDLPKVGSKALDFELVNVDLTEVKLSKLSGKKKVLNIFPSVDTAVCSLSVKTFYEKLANRDDINVLNISKDLPFPLARQLSDLGNAKNVYGLSAFRSTFSKDYGLELADTPLRGLCSRAVIVLDEDDKVLYSEQVPEITQEPNYDKVLEALKI